MALEGSIKDISLAAIFQLFGMERKTGVLTLRRKDEEVTVTFLNGMVVNADSKHKRLDDRLGNLLVRTGKLAQEQLARVLKLQKDTLRKMGHILIAEKLLTPQDLKEVLQLQITQTIYQLFRWREGDYQFHPETKIEYDKEFIQPMSTESLLMEGMRMIDEWPIIERKIPSFAIVFEKVAVEGEIAYFDQQPAPTVEEDEDFDLVFGAQQRPQAEEPSDKIRLSRDEDIVYRHVDGLKPVRDIIDLTLLGEFDTCRALYDLLNRNLIAPKARVGPRTVAGKKAASDFVPKLVKFLYPILGLLLAVSPFMMLRNPLNLFVYPLPDDPLVSAVNQFVSSNRLARMRKAVKLYHAETGAYPLAIDALVKEGLLSPRDLKDPWDRPFEYERLPSGEATVEGVPLPFHDQERDEQGDPW